MFFSSGAVVIQSTSATSAYSMLNVQGNNRTSLLSVTQGGGTIINGNGGGALGITGGAVSMNSNDIIMGNSGVVQDNGGGTNQISWNTNGMIAQRSVNDTLYPVMEFNANTAGELYLTSWDYIGFGVSTMTRYGLAIGTETAAVLASSAPFVVSTAQNVIVISSNGYMGFSGVAPTYSGCGTVTVLSSSVTAQSGSISMGGSPGNTCTVTFPKPFIGTPSCLVTLGGSLGTGVFGNQGATTSSSVIGTCDNATGLASCGAGTTMAWHCFGN
jgi:hypothetical protein